MRWNKSAGTLPQAPLGELTAGWSVITLFGFGMHEANGHVQRCKFLVKVSRASVTAITQLCYISTSQWHYTIQ